MLICKPSAWPLTCRPSSASASAGILTRLANWALQVENKAYQCQITSPYIPYSLYVHEDHLLLVPREVDQNHPKFPAVPDQNKRYTLRLADHAFRAYTERYGEPSKFTQEHVGFGLEEDDGVVVAAVLPGSNMIPYWAFDTILASTETEVKKHFIDQSSSPLDSFGIMQFDLRSSA